LGKEERMSGNNNKPAGGQSGAAPSASSAAQGGQEQSGVVSVERLQQRLDEMEAKLAATESARAKMETTLKSAGSGLNATEERQVAGAERVAMDEVRKQARVRIRIPSGEGSSGKDAVFVCVNGLEYHIPRDKEVKVPKPVYQALLNATVTDWEMDVDNRPNTPHEVPRYNVQVLV
jgi:hypothetical protein